jgi:hypothetical protein
VTTSVRFGVDPAELLAAATAARDIQAQLSMVREALLAMHASGPHAWASDIRLAAVSKRAVEALLAATHVAVARAVSLEHGLAVSAESYARSDSSWVR